MAHAAGKFDVKVIPQQPTENVGDPSVGRMALDKRYHGELDAVAKGEMLAVMAQGVQGSGGYVAMERVDGTLGGRRGTFALQHGGTMARGAQQLSITVVPDTGTGELAGITGKLDIKIVDGQHFYEFEYTLS